MAFHPTRIQWFRTVICWAVSIIRPQHLTTRTGFRLWIPKRDRSLYVVDLFLTGFYEKSESLVVSSLLERGDTVVDVGANIGYYTCLFSRLVGAEGKVFSFEPVRSNRSTLRRNIELNRLNNVLVFDQALGSSRCRMSMHLSQSNLGSHSLIEGAVDSTAYEQIDVVRFDDIVPRRKIRLVKVDVEGFELSVLLGMRGFLEKSLIQYLLLEFTPHKIVLNDQMPILLVELLDSLDASVTVISNTIDQPTYEFEDVKNNLECLAQDKSASFNLLIELPI